MPSFFKTGKPKGFHFEPRFYDERKEDLEQRVERIKAEMGVSSRPAGSQIRGAFRDARRAGPKNIFTSTGLMGKLIRVVSVILIAAMLYLIFQAVGIMTLLKKQQKVITPTEFVE
jgi:hypothetical protein